MITDVITSREYAVAWGYVILLNIAVGIIVTVLNIVPFLGALVGVFVGFYSLIIAGWLWGNGFTEATTSGTASRGQQPTTPSAERQDDLS